MKTRMGCSLFNVHVILLFRHLLFIAGAPGWHPHRHPPLHPIRRPRPSPRVPRWELRLTPVALATVTF